MKKQFSLIIIFICSSLIILQSQSISNSISRLGVNTLTINGELDNQNVGDAELYLHRCNNNARAGINFDISNLGSFAVLRSSWFMGIDGDQHFRIRRNTKNGFTSSTTSIDALFIDDDDNNDFNYNDPAIIIPNHSKLEFFSLNQNNDLRGSSLGIEINSNNFIPDLDNFTSLGLSSIRFVEVHAAQGLITSSDRRLKEDIHELPFGIGDLLKLNPISYQWKNSEDQRSKIGLIAQEVERILPEIIKKTEVNSDHNKSSYSINYAGLIPVLIQSIKDQQQEIEQLKSLIEKAKLVK